MSKHQQNMLFMTLDDLVATDHPYRKLDALLSFDELAKPYVDLYSAKGRKEKGVVFGLRVLVLQLMEDMSDREMERFLRENNAGKWFCELGVGENSPDYSYFGDFRKRLGIKNLIVVFNRVRESLKAMGLLREVFTFVDASHLVSKLTTWNDRDRTIKSGLEKFTNKTAEKITVDKQARFGCKGGNQFWYGYKEHASVDMQSGLINKIAATLTHYNWPQLKALTRNETARPSMPKQFGFLTAFLIRLLAATFFALLFVAQTTNAQNAPSGLTLSLQENGQPLTNHVVAEDAFTARATVTLVDGSFTTDTEVPITVVGSGIAGVIPFTVGDFSITIPAGQTSASTDFTVTLPEAQSDDAYGDEIITLTATPTSGLTPSSASFTLTDRIDTTVTILSNNQQITEGNMGTPTVSIEMRVAVAQQGLEGASGVIQQPLSIDYAISFSDTATAADVATRTGTLVIPIGMNRHLFTLPVILGDTLDENDEHFTITLSNPRLTTTDAVFDGKDAIMITIIDDDTTQVQFANTRIEVGEGAGSATFTITLAPFNAFPLTVSYETSDGTASAGSDYTATSASITIPAMATSATFSVPVLDDRLDEYAERFTVTLTGTDRGVLGAAATATVTIIDDDTAPTIVSAASNTDGNEIVITFSQTIANNNARPADFTVSGVASNPEVTALRISVPTGGTRNTLTLTLSNNIMQGETITLSYARTQGNIAGDVDSALLNNFAGRAVTNTTPEAPVITTPAQTVNTASFALSGTAEAGSTVELFRATGAGTTSLGSTTATHGTWTISVMLIDGANTITATAITAAGEDLYQRPKDLTLCAFHGEFEVIQ